MGSPASQEQSGRETPRWWCRWRRARSNPRPAAEQSWADSEGLAATMERWCRQIAPYMPNLSAATRKAILCVMVLVVGWRLVLWALELAVTVVCCVVGVVLVTCLVRPDTGLWLLTSVLPPYVQAVRMWIATFCLYTGQAMLGRPPPSQLEPPPSTPPSTPRSTRTILSRALPEPLPSTVEALA